MAHSSSKRDPLGSAYERTPGVWEIRKQCGRLPSGEPRIIRETVRGTEAQARAELYAISERMGEVPAEADGMTVETFFRLYFVPGLRKQGRANVTVYGYESTFRSHVLPRWGVVPLDAVRDGDVRAWAWGIDGAKTARKSVKLLRQVMRAAYDYGFLEDEPLRRRIPLPSAPRDKPEVWGGREVLEALTRLEAAGSPLLPVFCLMAGAGLRREEAMAVTRADMTYRDSLLMDGSEALTAFVRVDKAYTCKDGLKRTKNPQSVRTAAAGEPFSSALRRSMPDGPIVAGRDGALANPDEVGRRWTALFAPGGALGGMRRIRLMNLRHTNATLMLSSGVDPRLTAKAQGHSSEVEYGYYLNPTPEDMASAASAVSRGLASEE